MTSGTPPHGTSAGRWTAAQVRALGVHTDVPTAGSILGLGRTTAYALAARGEFPVRVVRVSPHRYLVPTASLLRLLAVEAGEDTDISTETSSDL